MTSKLASTGTMASSVITKRKKQNNNNQMNKVGFIVRHMFSCLSIVAAIYMSINSIWISCHITTEDEDGSISSSLPYQISTFIEEKITNPITNMKISYQHNSRHVLSLTSNEPSDLLPSILLYNPEKFSVHYYHGVPYRNKIALSTFLSQRQEQHLPQQQTTDKSITVDVLSVGSLIKEQLLKTQVQTWASHSTIRNFFGVTELDDYDKYCHANLTQKTFDDIVSYCKSTKRKYWKHSMEMWNYMRYYVTKEFKAKGPGWLCAQKRPIHGIGKIGRYYRYQIQQQEQQQQLLNDVADMDNDILPDYLLLLDDDSYINMNWFLDFFHGFNSSIPRSEAGCLMFTNQTNPLINHPWGGMGLFLSKGSIKNLLRPIHCNNDMNITSINAKDNHQQHQDDPFVRKVCQRIEQNLFGEKHAFQDGMSITDLMDAHASKHNLPDFKSWKDMDEQPYCVHSDWVTGYYVNYYDISYIGTEFMNDKENHPLHWIKDDNLVPRIGWNLGVKDAKDTRTGICNKKDGRETCTVSSPICHHLDHDEMEDVYHHALTAQENRR